MNILSIDPGSEESAYCIINKYTFKPLIFGIVKNEELIKILELNLNTINEVAIEMIASYGMPVGKEVFETCVWIGRFISEAENWKSKWKYVYRKDEKIHICGSMKAKDSNIRQALIDRFGKVGTKKNQGWFYGFHDDIWAAYAVGITYIENK